MQRNKGHFHPTAPSLVHSGLKLGRLLLQGEESANQSICAGSEAAPVIPLCL